MESEHELRIAENLGALGLRRGGVLLVHSSLSAMGWVPGGPETVIRGLLRALGADGTLLLPALSYEIVRPGGAAFDPLRTPSNVGVIPEYFRARPGTLRSVHPTHSVCGLGPLAESILGEHLLDRTPVGPHSPFRRVRDLGGQVLFLGCGLGPNTSMHGVEELVEPPYLFGRLVEYRLLLPGQGIVNWVYRPHNFRGWRQRYDRVGTLLEGTDALRVGKVLAATAYLCDAPMMWAKALQALQEDPFALVESIGES